ncbi:hypothetical protein PR202_ga24456 [Eleusine coracana subsp. coracana]|uniref:Uncharacterized protein n=1 Tax=Eleusine coracana subsp. coracana TaxID=191504 RepID=A0AAV5D9I9_ELECO|nr:hypothetical protein PR202_ga24456 [Eleusine coracana subsp. coracana]
MVSFRARKRKPELVIPALPTPHQYKSLSDIDDQHGPRFYPTGNEFFRAQHLSDPAGAGVDPVRIIRSALAQALVSYYPLAGRLIELPAAGGKLLVDCTAEGVVFVETNANTWLEDFGQPPVQPFPCVEELLCFDDIGEPEGTVTDKPLLFFQVTRLKDNGFAIGYRYCHSVVDSFGMSKLLDDVYRLARGEALTVPPVWEREILTGHATPRPIGHKYAAYEAVPAASAASGDVMVTTPHDQMVFRHFRFRPREMAAMRSKVPASLLRSTTVYELVTAVVWRCRTAALGYLPHQPVRLLLISSIASCGSWKLDSPIPRGYYGNSVVPLTTEPTAGELCGRPLRHALELVRKRKIEVTDNYVQSMLDLLVQRGRPFFPLDWTFVMSDTSGLSRRKVKLGHWERAGGGITTAGRVVRTSVQSYYDRCKGGGGEECVVVSMCLPPVAMDKFERQINSWPKEPKVISAL